MIKTIRVIGLLITLSISLFVQAENQYQYSTESAVYVVGDVHGAYHEIHGMLTKAEIIDADDNWKAGSAHFVSLGDLVDRGPSSRKVMDLFMKLQEQAEAAGGKLHVVLGNHEVMNLVGDLRYVSDEEYAEFAGDEDAALREQKYQNYLKRQQMADTSDSKAAFEKQFPSGFFAHRAAWAADGQYGRWVLSLPFVIKVNDQIFAHAGVSKALKGKSLIDLNQELKQILTGYLETLQYLVSKQALFFEDSYKKSLPKVAAMRKTRYTKQFIKHRKSLLFAKSSPTWYRGNALCHPYFENEILADNLAQWDAKRLWVGHTPSFNGKVFTRLNEQLVLIDTGMLKAYYAGEPWIAKIAADGVSFINGSDGSEATPLKAPMREEANPYGMSDSQVEEFLSTAEIISRQSTKEGRTKPFKVTLESGDKKIQAIFKYKNSSGSEGRGRMKKRGTPDRYKHEVAAYKLDRMLGIGLTPVTVERTIAGKSGSLQLWIEDLMSDLAVNQNQLAYNGYCDQYGQINLMNNFDYLIMNADRNQSNIMYSQADWQIWFIDHSKSFGTKTKRPKILRSEDIVVTDSFRKALEGLTQEKLATLSSWLSKSQIEAIWKRRNLMIEGDF